MSNDSKNISSESVGVAGVDPGGDPTPQPERKIELRNLTKPLPGESLKRSVSFDVIGPNGQSPKDRVISLRIYPVGSNPIAGGKYEWIDFDIQNNPFRKTVRFNVTPGAYNLFYTYQLESGKWSYWYQSGPYTVTN